MGAIRKTALMIGVTLFVVAPVVDRFVFPEPDPPESFNAPIGYEFDSKTEGFHQKIIHREAGHVWIELTLLPGAVGPPKHIHTGFVERFIVKEGVISLEVGSDVIELRTGEEFLIPAGTAHRPFNPNSEAAIVMGPLDEKYALPAGFDVFLTQAYGFFDEAPENSEAPRYDSWPAGPPLLLQRALYWTLEPIARVMGYRGYYPRFAPDSQPVSEEPAARH